MSGPRFAGHQRQERTGLLHPLVKPSKLSLGSANALEQNSEALTGAGARAARRICDQALAVGAGQRPDDEVNGAVNATDHVRVVESVEQGPLQVADSNRYAFDRRLRCAILHQRGSDGMEHEARSRQPSSRAPLGHERIQH
jgi:hypothetical protein